MSRHFAMLVSSAQARPAVRAEAEEEEEESSLRVGLASRVLSGPGLWLDRLEDLDRRGLIEDLLAEGVIEEAVATAPHSHRAGPGAEREDDLALRAGRVPVSRRGLRHDPAHHLRPARARRQAGARGCRPPGAVKGPGPAGRAGGTAGVRAGRRPH